MKGVQILGFKKTGKTALCMALLEKIKERGLRPCALKFTHNPNLDKEDTDTDLFLTHCQAVGMLSGQESAVFWNVPRPLPDLLSLLSGDILVMEGGRSQVVSPRVLVLNDPKDAAALTDPGLVLGVFGNVTVPGLAQIPDLDALLDLLLDKGFVLPGLNCGFCGRKDCGALAAEIVAGQAQSADCAVLSEDFSVRIGGAELSMNPFVGRVIRASILGMLGELRGFRPGSVEIRFGAASTDSQI